jgi:aspartate aminotransferase-like enzyme
LSGRVDGDDDADKPLVPDDAIDPEALAKERLIREIVAGCVQEELAAETIRVNMLGLCRSLGALSRLAADQSQNKQTCMEAAGVMAVTATCEQMLRSVSGFRLMHTYRFISEKRDGH